LANLRIPPLFSNPAWQECFEQFFESLPSHAEQIAHLRRLAPFFQDHDPEVVTQDDVEAYCRETISYHGKVSIGTEKRRRAAIRAFYDLAIKNRCFAGPNPARPPDKPKVPHLFADEQWQACLVAWVEQLRSDETRSSYCNILMRFFLDPDRTPDLYTRQETERFIRSAHASKVHNHGEPVEPSAQTRNLRRSALASFYEYCAGYQIVGDDKRLHALLQTPPPTKGIRTEQTAPAHRLLSESDLQALFSVIPQTTAQGIRDRSLFTAYLYLGRRNRELRLLWQDIEPYTFTDEKGQSYQGHRYRYHAKGKGQRWQYAELSPQVWDSILWYLIATDRLSSIQPTDGVFVRHAPFVGKEPLSSSTIRHILKKYAMAANLDPSICVHSFRHANAQWRYRCGQGLMEICKAMGHSHVGITHIYLQSLIGEQDTAIPALTAKFRPLLEVM